MKIGYIGSLKWEKVSTNDCFRLHIYVRTNKTLLHNSVYVFDKWGKNLSHRKFSTVTVRNRLPEGPS